MIPVLQVADRPAARQLLTEVFDFIPRGELLVLGEQALLVCGPDLPEDLIPFRFDHLAIRVADVDQALAAALAKGARIDADFSPDGPREIAAFGASGMRYAFCHGPEDWPLEFCAPCRPEGGPLPRHDHAGWRVADFEGAVGALLARGATLAARHRLGDVSVAFLPLDGATFEVFDEPPTTRPPRLGGWIGFVPADRKASGGRKS